jgi:general stress protein YciG
MADRGNQENQGGRGFASMDEEKQREIASEGGRAAHEKGTAHEFTSEEAREAGRKGGQASQGGGEGGQGRGQAGRGGQGGQGERRGGQ